MLRKDHYAIDCLRLRLDDLINVFKYQSETLLRVTVGLS